MLSPALMFLLLLQPPPAQQQAPPPDKQEQKQEKKAPPPAENNAAQPPMKLEEVPAEPQSKREPQPTQGKKTPPAAKNPTEPDVTAPPVELEETKPIVYSYDPAKASKALEVGNYYFKKGNWAAATQRFEESVKWNPKFSAGYLRLAEAREKKGELAKSIEAYRKYLELDPNSKKKKDVEKSIARLELELKD